MSTTNSSSPSPATVTQTVRYGRSKAGLTKRRERKAGKRKNRVVGLHTFEIELSRGAACYRYRNAASNGMKHTYILRAISLSCCCCLLQAQNMAIHLIPAPFSKNTRSRVYTRFHDTVSLLFTSQEHAQII